MNCETFEEQMMIALDGEINDIDRAKFKNHLKVCCRCASEYKGLEELVKDFEILNEKHEIEPPSEFEDTVMSKIREISMLAPVVKSNTVKFSGKFMLLFGLLILPVMIGTFVFLNTVLQFGGFAPMLLRLMSLLTCVAVIAINTVIHVSIAVVNTYYYVFVLIFVLIFAIERTFDVIMKRNYGGV